jgi:thioredoxin reductase
VDARGATSTAGVWAVGNVVNPSLKVATAAGNGMDVGTHVNEALVRADIALALEPDKS